MAMSPKRLLLDTHALIWALAEPGRLHVQAREMLQDSRYTILVSPASLYEITLKVALGKLEAPAVDLLSTIAATRFRALPLKLAHGVLAGRLPFHHRDPFDRLLIAQAQLENLILVTRDALFEAYEVSIQPC